MVNPNILALPPKAAITGLDDFYLEIQETIGGAGSSKKLQYSVLANAVIAAIAPTAHSSLTGLGADDHPQYLDNARGDVRYTPIAHETDIDPHPQYQTSVEVDGQIDSKIAEHVALPDPHPQYLTETEAISYIEVNVTPTTEALVNAYLASTGGALIVSEVASQLPPLVAAEVTAQMANKFISIALSSLTEVLDTGADIGVWFAPEDGELVSVYIGVGTHSTSGPVTVDMQNSIGSVFSTQPSVEASEDTSLTGTVAVLDGTVSFSRGDKFTFSIEAAGVDASGLQACVEYKAT